MNESMGLESKRHVSASHVFLRNTDYVQQTIPFFFFFSKNVNSKTFNFLYNVNHFLIIFFFTFYITSVTFLIFILFFHKK
jgi:hypothetical protein